MPSEAQVGRTKALGRVASAITSGATATTIPVSGQTIPGGAGFASSGTIVVSGGTAGMTPALQVTYTGYTTSGGFTGCSGITSNIPANAYITQCFLTGITGAVSGTSPANATNSVLGLAAKGFALQGMAFDMDFGTMGSRWRRAATCGPSTVPVW